MKISIITVCLNCVKTIERAIQSVIKQKYDTIEYIIIDGGSTDGTLDIIKKYADKISFWTSEPDNGIYDAMNKGIRMATGDFVAFMNSDDCYVENVFEKLIPYFLKQQVDIIYGDRFCGTDEGGYSLWNNQIDDLDSIKTGKNICHQSMFMRRELFQKNGLFDCQYKVAADYEWLLRNYKSGIYIEYIPIPICYYNKSGYSEQNQLVCIEEYRKIMLYHLCAKEKEKLEPIIKKKFKVDFSNIMYKQLCEEQAGEQIKRILVNILNTNEPVVIVGAGYELANCFRVLTLFGTQIQMIIDNDIEKWGKVYEGVMIDSPLKDVYKTIKHIISSQKYEKELAQQLQSMEVENIVNISMIKEAIYSFYH